MTEASLFDLIIHSPELERPAILERETAGQPELRQRVERLVAAHDRRMHGSETRSLADPQLSQTNTDEPRGSTPRSSDDHLTGTLIAGKYKLLERIGEGGIGDVWLAQQTEPVKRQVAVKLIKAGMDSKQVLARFEAERQALAMMDHPNIAKVLDGGVTGDPGVSKPGFGSQNPPVHTGGSPRPFFVMELVKGVPITEYCDHHKLTPKQRLELFVPVCQAIQHAHQKGVIHRDIKPSNVLIAMYDDRPVPKVIDFGVVKATGTTLTEHTLNTGFGGLVGTPEYMSPEQATFNNLDIDTRSDVYSLGVLLYELLAGSPPFTRKELAKKGLLEMLRVVREEEPPKPSTKLSTADALPSLSANRGIEPKKLTALLRNELDWIVMKGLEKDRTRRYETATGLARDVERYLNHEPVIAGPPSAYYRTRKFLQRNKVKVITASVLISLAIFSIGMGAFGYFQQRKMELSRERIKNAEVIKDIEKDFRIRETLRSELMTAWELINGHTNLRKSSVRATLIKSVPELLSQINSQEAKEEFRLTACSIFARTLSVVDFEPNHPSDDVIELAYWNGGWPTAIHPNGKSLAIGTPSGPIQWIRGVKPNVPPAYLPAPNKEIISIHPPVMTYSPRGTYLAYASNSGSIQIWNSTATRQLGELLESENVRFIVTSFDSNESIIWACREDGRFRFWTLPGFEPNSPWQKPEIEGKISCAAIDYANKHIALGNDRGMIYIIDRNGKAIQQFQGSTVAATGLTWSKDSKQIAVGFNDGSIGIWNSEGIPIHQFRPFDYHATSLTFHAEQPWLLAGDRYGTPAILDLGSRQQILSMKDGRHLFSTVANDGQTICGGDKHYISFTNTSIPRLPICEHSGHLASIHCLQWCKDNSHFVTLDASCNAKVWSINGPTPIYEVKLPNGGFFAANSAIALSHNARYIAYAGSGPLESPFCLIDINSGRVLQNELLPGGYDEIVALGNDTFRIVREEFDRDKQTVSSVVWDIAVGSKPVRRHVVRPSQSEDVRRYFHSKLSPDGQFLCWSGPRYTKDNHRFEIREVESGKLVYNRIWKQNFSDEGPGFTFTQGGQFLWLRISRDKLGTKRYRLPDFQDEGAVTTFSGVISANEKYIFSIDEESGARSDTAVLYRTGQLRPLLRLPNTPSNRYFVDFERAAFSPNSEYLAIGTKLSLITLMHLPTLEREIDEYDKICDFSKPK